MFSAHSSQPSSSTSASLWSTPSASSNRGPGKTPTTCANFTTPFVRDATQCLRSSNGFSFTFVEDVVNGIHLGLPILLVHIALLLHLAHGITVLLDINFVRSTLHCQSIDLLPKLEDITFVLTQTTLNATHPEVKCTKAS